MLRNVNKVLQTIETVEDDVVTNLDSLLSYIDFMSARSEWFSYISYCISYFFFSSEKQCLNDLIKLRVSIEKPNDLTADKKHRIILIIKIG